MNETIILALKLHIKNKVEMSVKNQKTILKYINKQDKEIERLKELCNKYEEEHSTAFNLWKMRMEEMPTYEEKEDYKSRIDKAIEYVKSNEFIGKIRLSSENKQSINKLLEILQGSDDK